MKTVNDDETVARETNDEIIIHLQKEDDDEVGDGDTSDAEGDGFDCFDGFHSFINNALKERISLTMTKLRNMLQLMMTMQHYTLLLIKTQMRDHSQICLEHQKVGHHQVLLMNGLI